MVFVTKKYISMLYTYIRYKITDNLEIEIVFTKDTSAYVLVNWFWIYYVYYKNIKAWHENLFLNKAMGDAMYVIVERRCADHEIYKNSKKRNWPLYTE